ALTGHAIDMGGTQVQIVEKRRQVPDIGAIDMRLRPLLQQMLQPNPDQRPDSMATVADWSFGAKASPKAASAPSGARADAMPEKRRSRGWRYLAAALALVVILGGAGGYYYYAMDSLLLPLPPAPTAGPALSPGSATQTKTAPKAPSTGGSQEAKG